MIAHSQQREISVHAESDQDSITSSDSGQERALVHSFTPWHQVTQVAIAFAWWLDELMEWQDLQETKTTSSAQVRVAMISAQPEMQSLLTMTAPQVQAQSLRDMLRIFILIPASDHIRRWQREMRMDIWNQWYQEVDEEAMERGVPTLWLVILQQPNMGYPNALLRTPIPHVPLPEQIPPMRIEPVHPFPNLRTYCIHENCSVETTYDIGSWPLGVCDLCFGHTSDECAAMCGSCDNDSDLDNHDTCGDQPSHQVYNATTATITAELFPANTALWMRRIWPKLQQRGLIMVSIQK